MFKGRKLSDKQRKHLSEIKTGKKRNPMNLATREKLSESFKKIWQERRENGTFDSYVEKIGGKESVFIKGQEAINKKKIGQYDLEDNLIQTFDSAIKASQKTNISQSNISRVCRQEKYCKTAGGYIWKFL